LHRDQVYEWLWPDLDGTAAANNLHKNLHYLRSALAEYGGGVTDFGPDRRSSFDRLRMSGYLFPLMVSLSNHGRDHVRDPYGVGGLTGGRLNAILSERSMNMMVRRARRQQAEERRAQLLASALEVFAAKGLDGATVKDLSDAAGVAQGLLYYYFKSKEELLQAVLDQHYFLPELRRIAAADLDRPLAEVLLELALGFARVLEQNRRVVQLMLREAPSNTAIAERIERGRTEGVRLLADFLAARVAAGELRPHDCEASARLVFYAVFAAHLAETPPEPFLPQTIDIVLHGLVA
jgi:TetR/AcrR family transcriptional regulator, cholesterol catabolism regulator